jgi:cytochrome c oxidase assembly factor CtaG
MRTRSAAQRIERRQFDLLRTALLVLGLVALVDAVRSYAIAVGRLTGP